MKGTAAEKHKDRLKQAREIQLSKKELALNKLAEEEVISELKNKALPVYGTRQEKLDRLKKAHGIEPNSGGCTPSGNQMVITPQEPELFIDEGQQKQKNTAPKDPTVEKIQKMELQREQRRQKMEDAKRDREEKILEHQALGKNIDVDFELLIQKNRLKDPIQSPHTPASHLKLCICVRKRPIFKKEEQGGENDAVSVSNPQVRVLAPKFRVDGITKFIENNDFIFDNAFSEAEDTKDVYKYSLRPLLDHILNQGVITCFAYGQTGSGKTFTMRGIQDSFVGDMFRLSQHPNYADQKIKFFITFFEIYGGRCYDLLNSKQQLVILEDKNGFVQIQNIVEKSAANAEEMLQLIEFGNNIRTTHATASNDTSSRSHAICQIYLRTDQKQVGKLVLVDLAGSERAYDCQSNIRQRRMEGAEINKSLLALKECIRAMDTGASHVPFRASKLTLVLRDSFSSKSDKSKIVMIACISPGSSSADHTINTLRYADRLKENKQGQKGISNIPKTEGYQQQLQQQQLEDMLRQEVDPPYFNSNNQNPVQIEPLPNRKNHSGNQPQIQPAVVYNQQQEVKVPVSKSYVLNPSDKKGAIKLEEEEKFMKESKAAKERQQQQLKQIQKQQQQHKKKQGSLSNYDESHQQLTNKNENIGNKIPQLGGRSSGNNGNNSNGNLSSDEESESSSVVNKSVKDDVRCMKETLKMDGKNKVSNEFFDFHEKVNTILEEQEEIFATHMAAIKEDAKLLTQESELISKVQGTGFIDFDIDLYAKKLDNVIRKKLKMYNILQMKLDTFKKHLQEEEEISSKVKESFYF